MVGGLDETFLVSNGDVLTTLNMKDLIQFHREQKAALTIAAMLRPDVDGLAAAEHDLEAAWREGIVDMQVLINGPRPVTLAPAPPTDLDLAA